jgi:DNA-binding Xre family transcriptional regulator
MNGNNPEAYSRLRNILAQKNMTVFQLHRTLESAGFPVNIKSIYRLATDEPLQKVDLRIAGAICRACNIQLGELITFEKPRAQLRRLDAKSQTRLDALMTKNNDGKLSTGERKEFAQLAENAHRMSIENARVLQAERRRSERSRNRPVSKTREAAVAA